MTLFHKYRIAFWGAIFILFNTIVFVMPAEIMGIMRFGKPNFWVAYGLVCLMILLDAFCSVLVFKKRTENDLFLRLPLWSVGIVFVAVAFLVGVLFALVPTISLRLEIVVCIVLLVLYFVCNLKNIIAVEAVSSIEKDVKTQTASMRKMTAEAEVILALAEAELKPCAERVYEALKYSDARSGQGLAEIEDDIAGKIELFKQAVCADDKANATLLSNQLLALVKERNIKCKMLKNEKSN